MFIKVVLLVFFSFIVDCMIVDVCGFKVVLIEIKKK